MNILDVIQQDGFTYKKAATTRGGEYHGPCPFCGGNDRFRIQPARDRFYCRQCGKSGDAVQYLRDHRGIRYFEALLVLGREPDFTRKPAPPILAKPSAPTEPSEAWQKRAKELFVAAFDCLWSEEGATTRKWLNTNKGLSDESILKANLGYVPRIIFDSRASWGLPEELNQKGNPKRQWIPAGIVIPLLQGNRINRLRIRQDNPEDGNRYIVVSGSSNRPMILGNHSRAAAVIVESEIDGILINQEAGDLVIPIAMGSAQAKPDRATHELLKATPLILLALDSDTAGKKAAWSFWPTTFGAKVKRWPIPSKFGKDPSEASQKGLNIRQWIMAGLPKENVPIGTMPITESQTRPLTAPAPMPAKDPVHDCGGTDGRIYMAKMDFLCNGIAIQQMEFLTLPKSEADEMLKSGKIKFHREPV